MESLLDHLAVHYGVNVRDYQPMLIERLLRRMYQIRIHDCSVYQRFLRDHVNEYGLLSRRLFVNYTAFFRDRSAWNEVVKRVLPDIVLLKGPLAPIRMWCAGCSSGEEAYTLAITALETIGAERFERDVKIFATDIDSNNLRAARQGRYRMDRFNVMEMALRDKYFTRRDSHYLFSPGLRRSVIFGSHDMLTDPPFLRIDLLLCRNTLMYFNTAAQSRVLRSFHRALGETGCLMLGRGEAVLDRGLFTADRRGQGFYFPADV